MMLQFEMPVPKRESGSNMPKINWLDYVERSHLAMTLQELRHFGFDGLCQQLVGSLAKHLGEGVPDFARNPWILQLHYFIVGHAAYSLLAIGDDLGRPSRIRRLFLSCHTQLSIIAHLNQPEDIKAAEQALRNGDAQKIAPSFVDPYYRKAFDQLNNPANNHTNGILTNNCKTETVKLNDLA